MTNYNNILTREKNSSQIGLFGAKVQEQYKPSLSKIDDWLDKDKVIYEFEAIGFYLSSHPLDYYKDILEQSDIITSEYLKEEHHIGYSTVVLAGMVISSKAKVSPKGRYLQAVLSDRQGSVELSFFDDDLLQVVSQLFAQNIPLMIKAEVRKDEGGIRVTGQEVVGLDDYLNGQLKQVELTVKETSVISEIQEILSSKGEGKIVVNLKIITDNNHEVLMDLGQKFKLDFKDCRKISDIAGVDLKIELKRNVRF
jgi:DNA polymerase III subunit alpha